jgi:acylaminoacyl-peptidase
MGGSYGGYMSAILGSRYPQYFKSAVIMNGVLDLIANMWFADIPEWNTVEALGNSRIHGLTLEDYQALWRQSPSSQPMKIPVLQFLGGKDRRVAWRQGLFYDAITKNSGVPISTYVY